MTTINNEEVEKQSTTTTQPKKVAVLVLLEFGLDQTTILQLLLQSNLLLWLNIQVAVVVRMVVGEAKRRFCFGKEKKNNTDAGNTKICLKIKNMFSQQKKKLLTHLKQTLKKKKMQRGEKDFEFLFLFIFPEILSFFALLNIFFSFQKKTMLTFLLLLYWAWTKKKKKLWTRSKNFFSLSFKNIFEKTNEKKSVFVLFY
jgi:hypothetical protein